mmetsp:Transcript_8861/g.12864  ORF Transcript_8861/g.12864 Transcript_8861/m.12864 type:complete len:87 (-) Transcript_8861:73-333(-)
MKNTVRCFVLKLALREKLLEMNIILISFWFWLSEWMFQVKFNSGIMLIASGFFVIPRNVMKWRHLCSITDDRKEYGEVIPGRFKAI